MPRRSTYAVRALLRLAQFAPEQLQLTSAVAAAEGIPRRFLEAILRELSRHGILQGRRGRGGGYALRAQPEQIDLATVIRIVDGPLLPFPCLERDGAGATRRLTLTELLRRVEAARRNPALRAGILPAAGGLALPRV